ncbi:MAG: acyl-CoA thioesterase [Gammaproteobacteria bacterium HGW-Gammaproteobacteria-11]|nr:MAG: acyl-CoA thioesterase [Gammaproteobacteria bacterium HGW-Gammaproteobacteria-11]
MSSHSLFDQAVALSAVSPNLYTGATSDAFANMVGPFGGLTAATLLNAVLQHPDRLGDPVSLTVNFAGPVGDGPFEVEATPLRTNRSTQHWLLLQKQNGEIVTSATAFFATRRETLSEQQLAAPSAPAAETLPAVAVSIRNWFKQYEFRFVHGVPLTPRQADQAADTESLLWVRDKPERPLDYLSLTALGDVFAPRIFLLRENFTPSGTVSMTHYFHATSDELARVGSGYLLGQAKASRLHSNYADQIAHLWSADGLLLLTSTQSVYFKE